MPETFDRRFLLTFVLLLVNKAISCFLLWIFVLYVLHVVNPADFTFAPFIRIETLDKCFSHDTVEEIIDALVSTMILVYIFWVLMKLLCAINSFVRLVGGILNIAGQFKAENSVMNV